MCRDDPPGGSLSTGVWSSTGTPNTMQLPSRCVATGVSWGSSTSWPERSAHGGGAGREDQHSEEIQTHCDATTFNKLSVINNLCLQLKNRSPLPSKHPLSGDTWTWSSRCRSCNVACTPPVLTLDGDGHEWVDVCLWVLEADPVDGDGEVGVARHSGHSLLQAAGWAHGGVKGQPRHFICMEANTQSLTFPRDDSGIVIVRWLR